MKIKEIKFCHSENFCPSVLFFDRKHIFLNFQLPTFNFQFPLSVSMRMYAISVL